MNCTSSCNCNISVYSEGMGMREYIELSNFFNTKVSVYLSVDLKKLWCFNQSDRDFVYIFVFTARGYTVIWVLLSVEADYHIEITT